MPYDDTLVPIAPSASGIEQPTVGDPTEQSIYQWTPAEDRREADRLLMSPLERWGDAFKNAAELGFSYGPITRYLMYGARETDRVLKERGLTENDVLTPAEAQKQFGLEVDRNITAKEAAKAYEFNTVIDHKEAKFEDAEGAASAFAWVGFLGGAIASPEANVMDFMLFNPLLQAAVKVNRFRKLANAGFSAVNRQKQVRNVAEAVAESRKLNTAERLLFAKTIQAEKNSLRARKFIAPETAASLTASGAANALEELGRYYVDAANHRESDPLYAALGFFMPFMFRAGLKAIGKTIDLPRQAIRRVKPDVERAAKFNDMATGLNKMANDLEVQVKRTEADVKAKASPAEIRAHHKQIAQLRHDANILTSGKGGAVEYLKYTDQITRAARRYMINGRPAEFNLTDLRAVLAKNGSKMPPGEANMLRSIVALDDEFGIDVMPMMQDVGVLVSLSGFKAPIQKLFPMLTDPTAARAAAKRVLDANPQARKVGGRVMFDDHMKAQFLGLKMDEFQDYVKTQRILSDEPPRANETLFPEIDRVKVKDEVDRMLSSSNPQERGLGEKVKGIKDALKETATCLADPEAYRQKQLAKATEAPAAKAKVEAKAKADVKQAKTETKAAKAQTKKAETEAKEVKKERQTEIKEVRKGIDELAAAAKAERQARGDVSARPQDKAARAAAAKPRTPKAKGPSEAHKKRVAAKKKEIEAKKAAEKAKADAEAKAKAEKKAKDVAAKKKAIEREKALDKKRKLTPKVKPKTKLKPVKYTRVKVPKAPKDQSSPEFDTWFDNRNIANEVNALRKYKAEKAAGRDVQKPKTSRYVLEQLGLDYRNVSIDEFLSAALARLGGS